jgi:hypothetical protein
MMPVVTDTRYVLFGMLIQGAKDGSKESTCAENAN